MTDWYTEPAREFSWLLGDGTVLEEPVMEASGSKRRVRIFGRQDTSQTYGARYSVMMDEVRRIAKRRGTYAWMPLKGADSKMHYVGCAPDNGNTDLFLVTARSTSGSTLETSATKVFWTFQHPTLPIRAQVVITGKSERSTHNVTTKIVVPDTRSDQFVFPEYAAELSPGFTAMRSKIGEGHAAAAKIAHAVETDLPDYIADGSNHLGSHGFISERQAAKQMLDAVRWADSLETIQIPDMRPDTVATPHIGDWLELELVETNMNGQLTTDLTDFLTNGPTIDKALDAYNEFQAILKSLGVVLPKVSTNQIQRMLLAGDDKAVSLNLMSSSVDLDGVADHKHTLSVHLTTGTMAVKCNVTPENTGDIADSWNEAQAIASITGKETELLAYAREFARTNDETKTRRLIARRRAGLIVPI